VRFHVLSRLEHPSQDVLDVLIEEMERVVPFLSNVDGIETQKKELLSDGRVSIRRRWQGSASAAPAPFRPFLSKDSLAWIDTATWDRKECSVEWCHQPVKGAIYTCSGKNFYAPDPEAPDTTLIRLAGDLVIHPEHLPGVPTFIGKRLAPQIEAFIIKRIEKNVAEVSHGLAHYLRERRPSYR
jgi:hypothetical protein